MNIFPTKTILVPKVCRKGRKEGGDDDDDDSLPFEICTCM